MRRLLITVGLAVVVAMTCLGVAACGTSSTSPIELTAEDSGSSKDLAVGQELRITLAANPTTGYQWAIDGDLPPQLEQVGEPEYSTESKLVGAGGQEVWTFKGKSPGSGALKLKYWRSFEPTAPPAETFSVTVVVK